MEKNENKEKEPVQNKSATTSDSVQIIMKVIGFLQLFMSKTLAKRITSMVLIAAGMPDSQVTSLTGYCDKSVRTLRKALGNGETAGLFHVGGGGRHSKLIDVEEAIIKEINQNSYHSHQQIADMVQDKFKIKVSPSAIHRLLKKTASKD